LDQGFFFFQFGQFFVQKSSKISQIYRRRTGIGGRTTKFVERKNTALYFFFLQLGEFLPERKTLTIQNYAGCIAVHTDVTNRQAKNGRCSAHAGR
jgi:hypothetical protein